MKTKLIRVNNELAEEIERIAEKNKETLVRASKLVAQILKNSKNRKLIQDISF